MRVGSLFSGIGGMDLGLERAGMTVAWQSEIDPYCCRVLKKHWPDVPNLGDITEVRWDEVEPVDLVCGGFPCQPWSVAGKLRGAEDDRHLWPAMLGAIEAIRPVWVVGENVPGIIPPYLDELVADLEGVGYECLPLVLPAAAFDAPHRRNRLFVVAHAEPVRELQPQGGESNERGRVGNGGKDVAHNPHNGRGSGRARRLDTSRSGKSEQALSPVAHTECHGLEGAKFQRKRIGPLSQHGDSGWWSAEPDVGRVAHGVPSRVDRLRGLGNAVVPQVAQWIGERIMEAHGESE